MTLAARKLGLGLAKVMSFASVRAWMAKNAFREIYAHPFGGSWATSDCVTYHMRKRGLALVKQSIHDGRARGGNSTAINRLFMPQPLVRLISFQVVARAQDSIRAAARYPLP